MEVGSVDGGDYEADWQLPHGELCALYLSIQLDSHVFPLRPLPLGTPVWLQGIPGFVMDFQRRNGRCPVYKIVAADDSVRDAPRSEICPMDTTDSRLKLINPRAINFENLSQGMRVRDLQSGATFTIVSVPEPGLYSKLLLSGGDGVEVERRRCQVMRVVTSGRRRRRSRSRSCDSLSEGEDSARAVFMSLVETAFQGDVLDTALFRRSVDPLLTSMGRVSDKLESYRRIAESFAKVAERRDKELQSAGHIASQILLKFQEGSDGDQKALWKVPFDQLALKEKSLNAEGLDKNLFAGEEVEPFSARLRFILVESADHSLGTAFRWSCRIWTALNSLAGATEWRMKASLRDGLRIVENLFSAFAFKYNHISISGEIALSAHRVCEHAVWDIIGAEIVENHREVHHEGSLKYQAALASVRGAHPSVFGVDDVLCAGLDFTIFASQIRDAVAASPPSANLTKLRDALRNFVSETSTLGMTCMGADQLLPCVCAAVVLADCPQLYECVEMLSIIVDEFSTVGGEEAYSLCTLQAAAQGIRTANSLPHPSREGAME
eukprot:g3663.t1